MNNFRAFLATEKWALTEPRLLAMFNAEPIEVDDDEEESDNEADYEVVGGVAIIPIVGTLVKYDDIFSSYLGEISTLALQNKIQRALDDDSVKATLLIIDSGGGMVSGTADLAEVIANSDKPIVAYVSDTCCSGAYWIASQCDAIYANSAADIGSIGVYMAIADTSKLYESAGVEVKLIKAGDYKGTGVPGTEVTPAQVSDLQRGVDDTYELLVAAVQEGRGGKIKDARKLATGQTWLAAEAMQKGLIDGIGSLNEVAAKLQRGNMATNNFSVAAVTVAEAPAIEMVAKAEFDKLASDSVTKIEAARIEGAKAETDRLAGLMEVAGDRPSFVLEQFKLGHSKAQAYEALTNVLKAELAQSKNALATSVVSGASAVAVIPVETRIASDGWESLTPAEQKQAGTKELFDAYKKALIKFDIK